MKSLLSIMIFCASLNVSAANMAVQGLLGFQSGATNIGVDVDFQKKRSHSFGAFFLLATEKDNVRDQFWSLGGDFKVFFGPDGWKLYLAPGLAVSSFDLANGDSEVTFGTIMKVGSLLAIAPEMFVGLEYMYYVNWFSDQAPGAFFLTNAVFRMNF